MMFFVIIIFIVKQKVNGHKASNRHNTTGKSSVDFIYLRMYGIIVLILACIFK